MKQCLFNFDHCCRWVAFRKESGSDTATYGVPPRRWIRPCSELRFVIGLGISEPKWMLVFG